MAKAIFLDRDGVVNRAVVRNGRPFPPASLAEMEILPGVKESLTRLKASGYLLIVVTNQPDVARGTATRETVEEINDFLLSALPIDEFRTCYHDGEDACDCRKPKPGLLLAAAASHHIDLGASFMVGDRWRDTEAGDRAGCKTILIDYGYSEKQPLTVDYRVLSLKEAAEIILGERT
ncbi:MULTISPECIES: HAD family hydrolase [unclassified Rhizobium]|uniref:D-glycero-alpha-D-manno-heptose-1,7-bisphosphate 7-phosphatase n=1 Tax=unclassified Rhizobium TaxID=2613769 RepID=UPI001160B905|nr:MULTISPECIES: HAD family hydrolase [unclassified Rhizobium]TQX86915.1 HAD family hydrolase [Rhizobium sp. rho-13.1]TQY08694.1 HAD family hydrolase [Rhizobium sp. rho-1.1]